MAKLVLMAFLAAATVGEQSYAVGEKAEFDRATADDLIKQKLAEEAKPDAPAAAEKGVKVRMLRDHHHEGDVLACNTVQTLPRGLAKSLVAEGAADDHPEQVKYAEQVAREEAAARPKVQAKK